MAKPEKTPMGYMFDCLLDSIKADNKGHVYITLKTHAKVNEDIASLCSQPLKCAIKTLKSKKSNNANAYCWELCAAIAASVNISSQEIYQEAIRNRGVYKDYVVPIEQQEEVNGTWSAFGIGWFTEKVDFASDDSIILRCYYGSSVYNSAQMARVINYLTDEANNLGLTVLSSRTKDELIDNWQPCVDIEAQTNSNYIITNQS